MSEITIKVDRVGKKFSKSLKDAMFYGMSDIVRSVCGSGLKDAQLRKGEFWALDDISFELKAGETLGMIGPNGSGKTTLLRMLNGIFMPDKGKIEIEGRVGGLIQVGAGFHPMLSGRENIYINGSILGMSKKEIDEKFDSIVSFADIGDFLEAPVKHYSSGMFVRLGFAVAIHCQPDILLIDEILSVGDIKFQTKCTKYMTKHLLNNGCTIIFVSHNRYAVQDICEYALYLNRGKMIKIGKTANVMDRYLQDMRECEETKLPVTSPNQESVHRIEKVEFLNSQGQSQTVFQSGEAGRIRLYYSLFERVSRPSVGITFIHSDERYNVVSSTDYLFNLHSGYDGFEISELTGSGYFEVVIDQLFLPVGVYKYMTYLFSENNLNLIEKNENAGLIEIQWSEQSSKRSLIDLPHSWNIQPKHN